jgi:hypothetical protein
MMNQVNTNTSSFETDAEPVRDVEVASAKPAEKFRAKVPAQQQTRGNGILARGIARFVRASEEQCLILIQL